ncbi:unnamed protein product [Onchocerca flexuosa]|uniref:RING-type E3 ubiquitin transferase n=1 Tax=Onchocerca flexuosa TaxID=387005 RepID=A0A183I5T0_9BILA|nr:unnamed protein product [Onchocerca flexuosa]
MSVESLNNPMRICGAWPEEATDKYLFFQENKTEDSVHMAAVLCKLNDPSALNMLKQTSTTTLTSKILCRYFANNICREGSSCPFSHDRNSKPDRTCRYYLIGKCAFGTMFRSFLGSVSIVTLFRSNQIEARMVSGHLILEV